ncbi:hypothetical protein LB579_31885 [Mesorhizobium sp. BR1-1-7]|uniref:hypothetical protein n=1 Tax=Mesorhizobium sp. BR1-1-7 TaxID=2876647 RepID=UPI001CC9CDF7|nr:hypothetical protein [Mesorhizobium sp. BR1-1-7]MBZ9922279.1 hypothetical protein [Mesorhizobium sp. BR1-1-7]
MADLEKLLVSIDVSAVNGDIKALKKITRRAIKLGRAQVKLEAAIDDQMLITDCKPIDATDPEGKEDVDPFRNSILGYNFTTSQIEQAKASMKQFGCVIVCHYEGGRQEVMTGASNGCDDA